MKRTIRYAGGIVAALAVLAAACATTQLSAVWRDDGYQGHPKNILMIAAVKNVTYRRSIEQEFVRQLKARGVNAVAAFTVFPGDETIDKATVVAKIQELGSDAVLVSKFVEQKTVTSYVPSAPSGHPGYYGSMYGYYSYTPAPGYTVTDEYAVLVTNLYDAKTERLVWTAMSETYLGSINEKLIPSFVETILKKLTAQNVLLPPAKTGKN